MGLEELLARARLTYEHAVIVEDITRKPDKMQQYLQVMISDPNSRLVIIVDGEVFYSMLFGQEKDPQFIRDHAAGLAIKSYPAGMYGLHLKYLDDHRFSMRLLPESKVAVEDLRNGSQEAYGEREHTLNILFNTETGVKSMIRISQQASIYAVETE